MKKILNQLFRNDLNRILDCEEIPKRNYLYMIIHYLLENKKIDLTSVLEISKEFEEEYERFLKELQEEMVNSFGNIIQVFGKARKDFNENFNGIFNRIEELRENGKHKSLDK